MKHTVEVHVYTDRADAIERKLDLLLTHVAELTRMVRADQDDKTSFTGGRFMFIVQDTQPDVVYTITPPTVTDAKGNPVAAGSLTFAVTSDNPSAVAVTQDPANPLSGTVVFGSDNPDGTPATANINVAVTDAKGDMLGSFGAQFTVTAGDPAKIAGGSLSFAGLTEAPPATP